MSTRLVGAALVLAALLAGCGDEGGTADGGGTAPTAASPSQDGTRSTVEEYGGEGSDAERAQAGRTASAYLEALAANHWTRACSKFSAKTRTGLERLAAKARKRNGSGPTACPQIVRTLNTRADRSALRKAADIRVRGIRVEGARAQLLYEDGEGTPSAIAMDREGGKWWVADIAGGPLSRGA
jgi:hypothetical protein